MAVFDFDRTLTSCDSFRVFLRKTIPSASYCVGLLRLAPILAGFGLRLISRHDTKQAVVRHFFGGKRVDELSRLGEGFARDTIPSLLVAEPMSRLRWHQQQGHRTILVSASPEVYLAPWAKANGFQDLAGTRLEVVDGLITGRFIGRNCYGPEKVVRLRELIGNLGDYTIYAYGDSAGDTELLAAADHPYYRKFSDD